MSETFESGESNISENVIDLTKEIIEEIVLSVKQSSRLIEDKKAIVQKIKSKGKSDVWKNFGKILVNGLKEKEIKLLNISVEPNTKFYIKDIVACIDCNACYTHNSHKCGT